MYYTLTGNIWDTVNNFLHCLHFIGQSISSPHFIGIEVVCDLCPWNQTSPLNGAMTAKPSERATLNIVSQPLSHTVHLTP